MDSYNLGYQAHKELMEKKTIESFTKYWEKAQKDGWRLDTFGGTESGHKVVCPPVGHESNGWAGYYFEVEKNISAPHWFAKFYPV